MTYDSSFETDRRAFAKLAAATMLATGVGARAYARAVMDGMSQKKIYPDRWVYISRSFNTDRHVEEVRAIARTASEHGITALVLSGLDRISLGSPEYLERLREVKTIADQFRLEIIPSGFNTGYGGAILDQDKNLAEGMLVNDALFVAWDAVAPFVADPPTKLENGGFEQFKGDRFASFEKQDEPGRKTFVDTNVAHSGKASPRMENFGDTKAGIARVAQQVRLTPNRCYRVSAWVKTEKAAPDSLFSVKALAPDGRDLSPFEPPAPAPTSDWRQVTTAFNSWCADQIELNFGVFEGVKGKVWVDDVAIEEVGLMKVLRRKGTPLTVRDEVTGKAYEEGRDFAAAFGDLVSKRP